MPHRDPFSRTRSFRRRAQVVIHSPYTMSSQVAITRPPPTTNQSTRSVDTLGQTSLYPPPPYSGGPPSYDGGKVERVHASVSAGSLFCHINLRLHSNRGLISADASTASCSTAGCADATGMSNSTSVVTHAIFYCWTPRPIFDTS
jgi:hypothetical protein